MFYGQLFTSKRGTLTKVWLAAHWEKKVTKTHVFECDLEATIREMLSPEVTLGLRISGHLLLGVVRIFSKKTRYLLTDCSDASVKIKTAFRPGLSVTDLPADALEATLRSITLKEDFSDFDSPLPDPESAHLLDHVSLNQGRPEDISLRENFGNDFHYIDGIMMESQPCHGLLSFGVHNDGFGDEDMPFDFFSDSSKDDAMVVFYASTPDDLPTTSVPAENAADSVTPYPSSSSVRSPPLMETVLLPNVEDGFALAPVPVTPSSTRKQWRRKRKLLVDCKKALTQEEMRAQLSDSSDLLTSVDVAPPTKQLMEWRASGGVKQLFSSFCIPLWNPALTQLFPCDWPPKRRGRRGAASEPEDVRQPRVVDTAQPLFDDWSFLPETVTSEEHTSALSSSIAPDSYSPTDASVALTSCPDSLPEAEVSRGHAAPAEQDRRMTSRALRLLHSFKRSDSSPDASYSLHALCLRRDRCSVAAVFFCLLVLRKQGALILQQSGSYRDIIATPGPLFHAL